MSEAQEFTGGECQKRLGSIGDALYVIGGKWKLRVIVSLKEGDKRFNEILRKVDGISSRVLSNELKQLEMNGFVARVVHSGRPVIVEYQLTNYSETLDDVLESLSSWGAMHKENLKAKSKRERVLIS